MFSDRADAAMQLARRLAHLQGRHPLVLAIPPRAVSMAWIIADVLHGDLDVALVEKIRGAPGAPTLTVATVTEHGLVGIVGETYRRFDGNGDLHRAVAKAQRVLRARRALYTPGCAPARIANRTVVVVTDGCASGVALRAVLEAVRDQRPRRLVAALGGAPPAVRGRIAALADEVVCLVTPATVTDVAALYPGEAPLGDPAAARLLRRPQAPRACRPRA